MVLKWAWSQAIRMLEQRVVFVNEVPRSPPTQFFTTPAALPPTVTFKVETTPLWERVIACVSGVAVSIISYSDYNMKKALKGLEDNDEKGQQGIRSLEMKEEELKMKISNEKERAAASTKSKLWFFQRLW